MKELSVKEKALDVVKQMVADGQILQEVAEKYFPELKESEDERIRKEIISALKWANHKGVYDKHIDWLEKQGGQKETLCDKCRKRTALGRCALEKQGEQKPEWSEEDEKMFARFAACLGYHYNDCIMTRKEYEEARNWLKSLKDRVQPKQEWSEEDERNASYICAALDCYYRLREDRNNTNGQEDLDEARNWLYNKLKSLRPQNTWKPSDEQMEAMQKALVNLCGKEEHNIITGLYYDLKKLREE